jgi:glycosyltransferase involved in cell wall biosynthesis
MKTEADLACGFRSFSEATECYSKLDTLVFVSRTVRDAFLSVFPFPGRTEVLYNTNDTEKILALSKEDAVLPGDAFCWCGVGKLAPVKGFDRMIRIQKRLFEEGYQTRLCILGIGALKAELEKLAANCGIADSVTFFGYQINPYKYVAKCDLFVCASHSEGFSTAATEALIVGTPVCTVEVSGMKEMLGACNEYGIVTDNDEDSLYLAIKKLLDNPDLLTHYKQQAFRRGKEFSTEHTVQAVAELLMEVAS